MSTTVPERMRAARVRRGMTQAQLAERLEVTPQTISEWELGEAAPADHRKRDVAKELGISVLELIP